MGFVRDDSGPRYAESPLLEMEEIKEDIKSFVKSSSAPKRHRLLNEGVCMTAPGRIR